MITLYTTDTLPTRAMQCSFASDDCKPSKTSVVHMIANSDTTLDEKRIGFCEHHLNVAAQTLRLFDKQFDEGRKAHGRKIGK